MDSTELEAILAVVLADDPPPALFASGDALFALRVDADELARRVETDAEERADGERVVAYVADTHSVAIAVAEDQGLAQGQLVPKHRADVRLASVAGPVVTSLVNESGEFALAGVPPGPVQLLIEPGDDDGPSIKTEWSILIERSAEAAGRTGETGRSGDAVVVQRLAARAASAADEADRRRRTPLATVIQLPVALPGRLEPPSTMVSRTLAPAAQPGARALPSHRWVAESQEVDVTLEEDRQGRLTLTVTGGADLDRDVLLSVGWSTTSVAGETADEVLVTPLPAETAERRAATYEVGPAADVRAFGLTAVMLVPSRALTPDIVEQSLQRGPYGNAVRAWQELIDRSADPRLREALDGSLDT